jgi:transcriptional regulator with XRE-family HTH domain
MTKVSKNLKFLRSKHGFTQKQLAEKLGLKQAALGAYEEERATPPLASLLELTKIFQVNLEAFIHTDLSKEPEKHYKAGASKGKEVLAITVDLSGRENIELVSQKASAGYLSGYQDTEFIKELPKISMPVLSKNKTYRAFEIQGDSMLPVLPGSIIFGEYQEDVGSIKNGKPYLLVTRHDGIVFKRIFNFSDKDGKLLLVSDNRNYEPYTVDAKEVLEVWAAKAFFSNQFPDIDASSAMSADQLAATVLSLQEEIRKLKRGKPDRRDRD